MTSSEIEVVWGCGEGTTSLGAFDTALEDAGIHNYNLVELTSVIPKNTSVVSPGTHAQRYDVGTLMPAVVAASRTEETATTAAGLGWALASEGGVFYEAAGDSKETCRSELERGLADARELRNWDWNEPEYQVIETETPAAGSAVVAALYGPLAHDVS